MHLIGKFGFFFINVYLVNLNLKEKSLQIFEISVKKKPKKKQKKNCHFSKQFLNTFTVLSNSILCIIKHHISFHL